MDMSSTSSKSTSKTSMSSMPVVFFTSTTTPLYSTSWSPSSTGWYAATCIFLIIFATVFKFFHVYRARREHKWKQKWLKRQNPSGDSGDNGKNGEEPKIEEEPKTEEESHRPWRTSEDVPRACLDVLVAGVGYLLMLAVMTLNVGYFMSILGGTFLGTLVFGRYAHPTDQGSKPKKWNKWKKLERFST